jgi:hypothetical protein
MVAHEQSLQLHRGRKVLRMKVICTRNIKWHKIVHNAEETFVQQFFNLMRKPTICCVDAYFRNQFGSQCHCQRYEANERRMGLN